MCIFAVITKTLSLHYHIFAVFCKFKTISKQTGFLKKIGLNEKKKKQKAI